MNIEEEERDEDDYNKMQPSMGEVEREIWELRSESKFFGEENEEGLAWNK